jgi:hypothetical protein
LTKLLIRLKAAKTSTPYAIIRRVGEVCFPVFLVFVAIVIFFTAIAEGITGYRYIRTWLS